MKTIYTQYSEDGERWSFGGAAPFQFKRTITVERDKDGKVLKRTEGKAEKIEVPKKDPASL